MKAVYFDAEGTLVSVRTHDIPPDARDALRLLGREGVKRILCTGCTRETAAPLLETGLFDGAILLNGQLVELGGRIVRDAPLERGDLAVAVEAAERGEFTLEFFGARDALLNRMDECVRRARRVSRMSPPCVRPAREALEMPVYQLRFYSLFCNEETLTARARNLTSARWSAHFADIFPSDGGRARGCEAVNAALGILPEETVAFGSGENDIGMLRMAGIGVAMGSASTAVRHAADYVTPSLEDGGLLIAVRYFLSRSKN